MLDVHPPHHTTHTWKDFWIHLGTITAGLLIAIGLEQSVEAIHRAHESRVLQEDLRTETEKNVAQLKQNIAGFKSEIAYNTALLHRAQQADSGVAIKDLGPLPTENTTSSFLPQNGAWSAARDSNELALLPRDLASVYEELYFQREFQTSSFIPAWFNAEEDFSTLVTHFAPDGKLDPAALSHDDRKQYIAVLSRLNAKLVTLAETSQYYLVECEAILHGADTAEKLHAAVVAAHM